MTLYIAIIIVFVFSCSKQEAVNKNNKPRDSVNTYSSLSEKQKKVLRGAKKCLEAGFKYDMDMAYYVLKYKDSVLTGSAVYPLGDLDPAIGVCTDVTIRALRWGGVCDLQEEIHEDIKANRSDYPMSRWNAKKTDPNIDHRRVPNQLVWFKKNWTEVSTDKITAGDVVVWDMNGDSWADHLGIVSDRYNPDGILRVIHNYPSPGYVAEEDVLGRWEIVGVFRVKE